MAESSNGRLNAAAYRAAVTASITPAGGGRRLALQV